MVKRRVDEPQQPVSQRRVAHHQLAQLPDIDGIVVQFAHNFKVKEPVGGHLALLYQHRLADIATLKERKASLAGLFVVVLCFHLLRDHRDGVALQTPQMFPFRCAELVEIHADVVA